MTQVSDESASAPDNDDEIVEIAEPEIIPEERIAALEAEIAQLRDQHLRSLAEGENQRRRLQRDREDAVRFAATGFARDLLSVADNLRRAIESVPEAQAQDPLVKTLLAGVAATEKELLAAFQKHNIQKIEALGQKFDHNLHQAMFETEFSGKPAGTVIQVLQPGYILHERLLRPAMVGVAKGEARKPETPPAADTGYRRVDTQA